MSLLAVNVNGCKAHIIITIIIIMVEVEKHTVKYDLPFVGYCTDSATNALNALIKLTSPSTYSAHLPEKTIQFVGLSLSNFKFYAPVLQYTTATIRDLILLKQRKPSSTVRHADINPHIKQICNATTRILTLKQ